jgi:predicted lipoprotein with Yx(FWY)xxD motif
LLNTPTEEEQVMKSIVKFAVLAVVFIAFLTAGIALADHHAVNVARKDGVGSYLTDIKGMTLYYFKKDTAGTGTCEDKCLTIWPLYFVETVAAKGGLDANNFGTITRADGKKQTTYKGMPLYYFRDDKAPGDTNGQGEKDVWYVVNP